MERFENLESHLSNCLMHGRGRVQPLPPPPIKEDVFKLKNQAHNYALSSYEYKIESDECMVAESN